MKKLLLFACACVFLSGCIGKTTSAPTYHELMLPLKEEQCLSNKRLGIATLSALGRAQRSEIAYVNHDGVVGYYQSHKWAQSPHLMLQKLLVKAFSNACLEVILPPFSGVKMDALLQGKLLALEVQLLDRESVAHVEMAFTLREGQKAHSWVIAHKEPIEKLEIPAIMSALNRATEEVIRELKARMREVLEAN